MTGNDIVFGSHESASQLVLLFHGVGSSAANLAPLAEFISSARPRAMVVSVSSPHPSTLGSGHEWFSVSGVTEENRLRRVTDALPLFSETVRHWQTVSGAAADATTLVGFSQGAIMALESTQADAQPVAEHIVALAGRFAVPVRRAPPRIRYNFIHGTVDPVIPSHYSRARPQP
jgi:phospholipase/carboxylesterase